MEKLIAPVSDIVGKFVKDKDLQAKLDHELQTLFHQANLAQIEILKENHEDGAMKDDEELSLLDTEEEGGSL